MRWLLALALLAGCESTQDAGFANTGAGGGTGGAAGMTEQDASAPDGDTPAVDAVPPTPDAIAASCAIAPESVSGRAEGHYSSAKPSSCPGFPIAIQIVGGAYTDSTWSRTSYMSYSDGIAGSCTVALRFSRSTAGCGAETISATMTVPAI